jgi:hypothetical protein
MADFRIKPLGDRVVVKPADREEKTKARRQREAYLDERQGGRQGALRQVQRHRVQGR